MEGNLTEEQQSKLAQDSLNRQPIGSDEILLVGDLRFGIPVLKLYYDNHDTEKYYGDYRDVWQSVRDGLNPPASKTCAAFTDWTRSGLEESLKTLKEVQRLRDLVREAESAVIAG